MTFRQLLLRSRDFRLDNKYLPLLQAIWGHQGIARCELSRVMRLSRGTVSNNVSFLLDEGAVYEGQSVLPRGAGAGRNTIGLYVNPEFFYSVGISLGNGIYEAVLFNAAEEVLRREKLAFPEAGVGSGEAVLQELRSTIAHLLEGIDGHKVMVIGIAVTGIVDFTSGDVFFSALFSDCRDLNLKSFIREHFDLPCFLINIAHLAPVMEKKWGQASGMVDFVTVDDHASVGLYLNGSLYRGWQQHAGEMSYMKISDSREIACDGRTGLIETAISYEHLFARIREAIKGGARPKILEVMKEATEPLSRQHLLQALELGDAFVEQLLVERYEAIAEGIVNLAYLLNPEAVFLPEWTSRFPHCTLDVVKRKMSSYGMRNWRLSTRILSSGCPIAKLPHGIANQAMEMIFDKALSNSRPEIL